MTTKRPRTVTSKHSRGACRTCRIRRIKCDEERPSCRRCVSTGRSCDGYSPGTSPRRVLDTNRQIVPSLLAQPDSSPLSTLERIDGTVHITAHERSSFGYFVQEMAAPLSRISHAPDWIPFALQLCCEQPAVLYALVAVGSGATAQTRIAHHSLTRLRSPEHDDLAVRQYLKATAALQKSINETLTNGASIGPILLCCLLFVVFESMRGESYWAISHLQHGRKAIQSINHLSNEERASILPMISWSPELTNELLSTIDQFQFESVMDNNSRSPGAASVVDGSISLTKDPHLPFESVEQAKRMLDKIIAATSKWREDLLALTDIAIRKSKSEPLRPAIQYCLAHTLSSRIDVCSDIHIENRRLELLHTHNVWLSAINNLEIKHQIRQINFMKIQHFVSSFTLQTSRHTSEHDIEAWTDKFSKILDSIHNYLNDATAPPPMLKSPIDLEVRLSFSLEYGVLPALYLISLKCRIPSIRQRALSMLRDANRREGSYWSGELSTYAESIVRLEEERAVRLSDIVIEGVSLQNIRVICCRYLEVEGVKANAIEILELSGSGQPPLHLKEIRRLRFSTERMCK